MTLNQIIARIQGIAEAHEQINTFFFGDVDEFLAADNLYPACFMGMPAESGVKGETDLSFSLYFLDRVIQGGSDTDNTFNETEVLSDQRETALDIFAQIAYQKFDPVWNVDPSFSLEYFNERDEDYLGGVKINITIKMPYTTNRCQVPTIYNYD